MIIKKLSHILYSFDHNLEIFFIICSFMSNLMSLKVLFLTKPLITHGTHKGLQLKVHGFNVPTKALLTGEGAATCFTR